MDSILFIDLTLTNALLLFLVGIVGGMVSGFIGSGGAFVLTPAMMTMGVPGIVAVASNICHKFPKALVGAVKRHKYGQVDVKLGLVMGVFAELGMYFGKHVMTTIRNSFGDVGTNLYVSFIFVVVLAIVGGFVLRDARQMFRAGMTGEEHQATRLAKWVQSIHIPGTMVHFSSIGARVSLLFVLPLGFATGMLAATIAVGGFIGVPAMIYVLGAPALMASATELVIAFVMGLGGTIMYAWDGVVDVRLAMIILAGSLFGIQVGAVGTTYVKDYTVKLVMGVIMITVMFSRFLYIPGYLSDLGWIEPLEPSARTALIWIGDAMLLSALLTGAIIVVIALIKGMAEHKRRAQIAALMGAPTE